MGKTNRLLSDSLRQQAEEILKSRLPITGMHLSEANTIKLIHELQLKQIELELQNKELLQAKEQNAAYDKEQRYRYMFASNPQPMWIYDLETLGFLEVNDAAVGHYGYSKEEFQAMTLKDIRPKEDIDRLLKDVELTRKTYNPAGEWRHMKKNGEIIHVEIVSHTVTYEGRKARHVMVKDITERKLAEEALQQSEERSRNALDHLLEGCQIIGFDWRYIYLNHTASIHNNRPNDELIGQRYMDMWPGIENTHVFKTIETVLEKRVPIHLENEFVFPDGNLGWFDLSIQPVPEGVFILSINITERIRKEQELYESEFRFSALYENGPFGMVMADHEFRFKKANPAFCAIMGYSEAELQQLTFKDVSHPDDLLKDLPNIMKLMNKEISVYKTEKRYIRKDGQIIWGSLTVNATYDKEGQFLYNLGIIEDITWRKLAEADLKKSKELLSETESIGKVGGWEFNIDTKEQIWTDEVYRIHEVDLDFNQNVDKGINFYAPASRPIIENAVQRVIEFGEPFDLELEIVTAKGNLRSVHTIGKADLGNRRVYGFFQDITERKLAEEEIIRLNERISTATRASQVGIWDWDVKNNRLTWDDQMYVLYGLKKEQFAGAYEAWVSGLHPDDKELGTKQTQLALNGDKEYDTEFRVIWPDGTIRYCKARGEVFRNEKGEPVRMVGVNYDVTQQKLIEKELQESEEYLKLGYDTANLGIWKNDLNTMTVEFDERARSQYGFEESVVMISDVIDRIHPDDKGRLVAEIEKATAPSGTGRYSTEYRVIHPDGSIHWLHIGVRVTFDCEGEDRRSVMGFGTSLDITERKLADEKLRESEARFVKAFFTNPAPQSILSLTTGQVLEVNDATCDLFGYSRDELFGIIPSELNLWEKPDEQMAALEDLKNSGRLLPREVKIRKKTGEVRSIIFAAEQIVWNGEACLITSSMDITERILAEDALRESEEKFRILIESVPLPVTYVNSLGEIVFRNDRFREVIGYTHEEVPTVNEWWGKAYPDETYRQWVIQNWESVVKNATDTNTDIEPAEYSITCKDGIERTMIVSGIIIEDNLLITFIDITDRKKAEEEVKKLNETLEQRVEERTTQLQEANRELEAFSYSVSHDLRAPLRHINGFVDLLTESYDHLLPEKGKHYLEVIVNSSRHMGTLIDDLLQFSRTGRQEMQQVNLDMNAVIQDVLNQMKHDTEERKIDWKIAVLPNVKGDQSLLRMAWSNLLSNAIKFTKAKDPAEIEIGFTDDKTEYIFFVRDNGAGFDMRFAHKLFGVFQRLHTTKEFEGTGIGLANVRRIILKHGGRTWAESQLYEGATFYFTLPKPKQ